MGEGDKKVEGVVHCPPIAIANKANDATGVGVVGGPGYAEKVLTILMGKLGPGATLADLKKLAEEGTTATPDGSVKAVK